METITIAGHAFQVPLRYKEGDELSAGEASALNQTYHENLRNNFAKKVKEGTDAGVGLDVLQDQLNAYAAEYQFGVRSGGGGGPRDPVMTEGMRIARDKVKEQLKAAIANPQSKYYNRKISDFKAEVIGEAAKALLARDPAILELAKKRVAELQSAATSDLSDLIGGMEPAPAEQSAA